ncbi:Pectin degradation repressor protein KdgR [uncultured delta proteobacterium]|uniref:Pectin degradation repressor protein KdgR n=1 Tax=uncultured delta proteobacterium TaxID=34034 RepID=A0A212K6Y0_9DELT|nr:Pectin degradation repressor protein KdgR [uncultured delta proteobacterium]
MSDKKKASSVIKALNILELLGDCKELGVTEIGEKLGYDKSTTFRLLATLKERNFVIQNAKNQKYSNAIKLLMLGNAVLRHKNYSHNIRIELKKLAETTRETVNLAIAEGTEVIYIDRYETEDILKLASAIGQRRPMYCTSVGKAIMAYYDPGYVESLCTNFPFEAFTEFTCTNKKALLKELELIRQRGYSIDNQEHHLGIRCVAVPILSQHNEPLAAVSISMPQFRADADPGLLDRCIAALLEASPRLTRSFLGSAQQ